MFSHISNGTRRTLLVPLLSFALVASAAPARQKAATQDATDVASLRAHITYLASDKLEGRRTGTPGAQEAARYVAREFMRYRLAPAGNTASNELTENSYLQEFPYVAGVEMGKENSMTLITQASAASPQATPATLDLRVGEDWMPLGFSANARIESTMVAFVGYGITAADQNYDDYKDADVKGNIALALAGTPDGDNPHGKFVRAGELRFKATAARAAGAKALAIITSEDNFRDDRLSHLKYDNAGGDAGLPVVVISRQAASKILGLGGSAQLSEFEKKVRERGGASVQAGVEVGGSKSDAARWTDLSKDLTKGVALNITTDIVRKNAPASNVVGVLEGSDPRLKSEVIVVGAHYDHLGRGGEGSLAAREGEIHHGADDNASGTAGLLELARLLSQNKAGVRRTVLFVAFGGEEEGLIGSSFYVNHPARPLEQTVAMINMDMIGRLKENMLMIGGVGTASEWRGWVEHVNNELTIKVVLGGPSSGHDGSTGGGSVTGRDIEGARNSAEKVSAAGGGMTVVTGADGRPVANATPGPRFALRLNEDGYGPSDHSSFYARRVPVLFFFTGSHEDYHKPSDTADRINYEGEARVLDFVREIVEDLQASDKRPTFAVAKAEANARSTGFRVYLGTVPSYAESTDGLKLDAVREGSPAEAAGLKAGDRVVKLAGRDVRNVYDYTQALSEMKAGQEYEVEVVRDGQRLTLKVTPAARK
jgi:hypothetical protein